MYKQIIKSFFFIGITSLFLTSCGHRTESTTTTDSSVSQAEPLQTTSAPVYLGATSGGRAL